MYVYIYIIYVRMYTEREKERERVGKIHEFPNHKHRRLHKY